MFMKRLHIFQKQKIILLTGPKAFVPHSAINLSVKTPELPESASTLDLSMTDQTQQVCVMSAK